MAWRNVQHVLTNAPTAQAMQLSALCARCQCRLACQLQRAGALPNIMITVLRSVHCARTSVLLALALRLTARAVPLQHPTARQHLPVRALLATTMTELMHNAFSVLTNVLRVLVLRLTARAA